MKYNILHLTDWHLNNPSSIEEKLRIGFFRDYINGLYRKVRSSNIDKIDLLICTGDFIDKGLVKNFEHAKNILIYIIEKFEIKSDSIFLNIGNHDVSVLDLNKGNKKDFEKFEKFFSSSHVNICSNINYQLKKIDNEIFILKLDSIFNELGAINNDSSNKTIIYPSMLSDESIDEIVTSVELNVKKESLLIITSHFPLMINNRMTMILEDDKWLKKHLWSSGMKIAKRILENRIEKNVLFLYGDGHLDNYWSFSDRHHFFMTGMFGGNYLTNHYISNGKVRAFHKTNDAKVIQYDTSNFLDPPLIYNFSYLPEAYDFNSQTGEWKYIQDAIRIETSKSILYPETPTLSNIQGKSEDKREAVECISQTIQEKILEEIRCKNLFSISRTATSIKESSLGWVSISNLFQNHELFCLSIEKMKDWISGNGIELDQNTLICGLGFWGSVFATQLGARTGIMSFCVSSKRIKSSSNYFENVEYVKDEITGITFKNIILVTDVISTGNSISGLKEELSAEIDTSKTKWYSISVLSDKTQERLQKINEFEKIGSLCISLPIPVVDNDKLPDESIFPITFDFR